MHAATPLLRISFVCLAFSALQAGAAEPPQEPLSASLDAARSTIAVSDQGLRGAGADELVERARRAQFVLIGEDHGFAQVPQFVLALKQSLGEDAPSSLAVEVGPQSAARLAQAARAGELSDLAQKFPGAIPFFSWREDAQLISAWQGDRKDQAIWGVDQEFILSARLHFQRLRELAPPGPARRLVADYLERAESAESDMMARHDPAGVLLPQLQPADFDALRTALRPPRDSEAAQLLDELDASAQIYRQQGTDPYASNHARSLAMKRHFMRYYSAAQKARKSPPRALFVMGAYHVGRGASPTSQFDLGNLAAELAASEGRESLHVLLIVAGGSNNRWLPFMADTSARASAYSGKDELASIGASVFLDRAAAQEWTLFDTRALQRDAKLRGLGGPEFANLVLAYDYVIVIPKGSAATEPADTAVAASAVSAARKK